ncbi:MAG TPA: SRPBCC family protein [Gemmatimonadaceae bacterium]|nr:SRPBCC family protein [Gemmatimonadaceae bacterium]
MLKWIGGGCLVIVLLVGGLMYWSFQKMSSIADEGPAVTVSFAATPERVYASLSDADSLRTWLSQGMALHPSRKGPLAAGDTIRIQSQGDTAAPQMAWVIDTVVPSRLITSRLVMPRERMVVYGRRDSIFVAGDSTRVTRTVTASSMMPDSLSNAMRARGGMASSMLDLSDKMTMASARMQGEAELLRLKTRIEGRSAARDSLPRSP